MSFYNYKNRVEISITKENLKQMAKEIQIPVEKLHNLVEQILTATFDSTIKELEEWIEKNVPLMPESDNYILCENFTPKDLIPTSKQRTNNLIIHEKDTLSSELKQKLDEEIFKHLIVETVEDSKPLVNENVLRDSLKMGLKSCHLKDGRFYRIRLGFMIVPWIYNLLNNNKNLPSYHFFEKFVEFSCTRTLHHLSKNYGKFCPTKDIQTYLEKKIEVICKKH
ncbi:hypothetical protein LCGC14_0474010 [marine sediment metagenome]|uniref:Uncharacterized protein n=1 Tax=marine sediment metagenome TaxID=412755 RepID=A0A0F9UY97_9ZZZZ|nr:hypothetical protein [bacterium]